MGVRGWTDPERVISLQEGDYFTQQGEFRVDRAGSPTLLNCLMYKMSYYRFGEMQVGSISSSVIFIRMGRGLRLELWREICKVPFPLYLDHLWL